jgi:protein-L-isoaspartate(D-aspartate) O-methyltransferase
MLRKGIDFEKKRQKMVNELKLRAYIVSDVVERAFLKVEREKFVPEDQMNYAYEDSPLPILCAQTISAPSMIAIMLEASEFQHGRKVLEIGTGSGYNAALIAEIVGPENVITVERHAELVKFGEENLRGAGLNIKVVHGDGSLGCEQYAPYDRIFATAGAPKIPKSWIDQTKIGGKIIAPIGPGTFSQRLVVAKKVGEGRIESRMDTHCAFVPLIGKEAWGEDDRGVW